MTRKSAKILNFKKNRTLKQICARKSGSTYGRGRYDTMAVYTPRINKALASFHCRAVLWQVLLLGGVVEKLPPTR